MCCNSFVDFVLSDVSYNEYGIKSWQNRALEINLLSCMFQIVIPAKKRVRGCQYRWTRIQDCGDSSFCNRDGLLLHGFMNCNSILWSHFIKLVNAYNASIGKDHSSSFKLEITTAWISDYWSCQTSSWTTFTACIDRDRCTSVHKFQELRLCNRWVSQKQHINIASKSHAIR